MTPNQRAFLDMIAYSEIGPDLLAASDDGYNVLVGSTAVNPILFNDYGDHPNVYNRALDSTAAGRYQLLHRWWVSYKHLLNLPDFGHDSQDEVALQQIKECKAFPDIEAGDLHTAINKCAHIWASLPGAGYGQHENKFAVLEKAYTDAGGTIA